MPQDPLSGKLVLIVDDDAAIRRALGEWFQRSGCRVAEAADGDEALASFGKLQPDVVITDIIMPNREGVETIMAMKRLSPGVKVLAISGGGRIGAGSVLELAAGLGADAVLAKPFRSAAVLDAVRTMLLPTQDAVG